VPASGQVPRVAAGQALLPARVACAYPGDLNPRFGLP